MMWGQFVDLIWDEPVTQGSGLISNGAAKWYHGTRSWRAEIWLVAKRLSPKIDKIFSERSNICQCHLQAFQSFFGPFS